jgi:hypothetical protein
MEQFLRDIYCGDSLIMWDPLRPVSSVILYSRFLQKLCTPKSSNDILKFADLIQLSIKCLKPGLAQVFSISEGNTFLSFVIGLLRYKSPAIALIGNEIFYEAFSAEVNMVRKSLYLNSGQIPGISFLTLKTITFGKLCRLLGDNCSDTFRLTLMSVAESEVSKVMMSDKEVESLELSPTAVNTLKRQALQAGIKEIIRVRVEDNWVPVSTCEIEIAVRTQVRLLLPKIREQDVQNDPLSETNRELLNQKALAFAAAHFQMVKMLNKPLLSTGTLQNITTEGFLKAAVTSAIDKLKQIQKCTQKILPFTQIKKTVQSEVELLFQKMLQQSSEQIDSSGVHQPDRSQSINRNKQVVDPDAMQHFSKNGNEPVTMNTSSSAGFNPLLTIRNDRKIALGLLSSLPANGSLEAPPTVSTVEECQWPKAEDHLSHEVIKETQAGEVSQHLSVIGLNPRFICAKIHDQHYPAPGSVASLLRRPQVPDESTTVITSGLNSNLTEVSLVDCPVMQVVPTATMPTSSVPSSSAMLISAMPVSSVPSPESDEAILLLSKCPFQSCSASFPADYRGLRLHMVLDHLSSNLEAELLCRYGKESFNKEDCEICMLRITEKPRSTHYYFKHGLLDIQLRKFFAARLGPLATRCPKIGCEFASSQLPDFLRKDLPALSP